MIGPRLANTTAEETYAGALKVDAAIELDKGAPDKVGPGENGALAVDRPAVLARRLHV